MVTVDSTELVIRRGPRIVREAGDRLNLQARSQGVTRTPRHMVTPMSDPRTPEDIARVTAVCRGRHHQQHTLKEQP